MLALGAPAPALAVHEPPPPTFTCYASALRVELAALGPLPAQTLEPFRTAPTGTGPTGQCPAQPQQVGLVRQVLGTNQLPAGLGTADVLFAETRIGANGPESRAGVLDLTLAAPQPIGPVRAEVLTSQATASCNAQTGQPQFAGSSTIAALTIGGNRIPVQPQNNQPPIVIPGPNGELIRVEVAQQTVTGDTITQRALVITAYHPLTGAQLARVTIAEAVADVRGCPPPPCPQGTERVHEGPNAGRCMKFCPDTGTYVEPGADCPLPPCPEGQVRVGKDCKTPCPGGGYAEDNPNKQCPQPPPPPPPDRTKCNAGRGNGSEPPPPPPECDPGGSQGKNRGGD
ncbi:MAG TPA: choice-of-anchor P family protein [Solirubrobacteraceae bacterium]|nr:choice-of-anchor P family protein [Solirubrobacteraceae bacterium]